MTEQQRLKLIDDFKSAIELHGNMGNPKLIKILKNDGDIPKLEGRYIAERTLLTYIGLARCRLGLDAKSPDPQRGDRSGKIYKKEDIDKAVDLYAKKYSISELAKEMGWSRSKTRRILMMNGAKVRSQSEGRLIHWTEVKKQRKVKTDDIS
ncbi:MAG: helix-turn-helix domain-containing protein [Nitrosomonas sp.]|nr:helix-turn-helix domain-containing protein [Nitrosomonas sp.]